MKKGNTWYSAHLIVSHYSNESFSPSMLGIYRDAIDRYCDMNSNNTFTHTHRARWGNTARLSTLAIHNNHKMRRTTGKKTPGNSIKTRLHSIQCTIACANGKKLAATIFIVHRWCRWRLIKQKSRHSHTLNISFIFDTNFQRHAAININSNHSLILVWLATIFTVSGIRTRAQL